MKYLLMLLLAFSLVACDPGTPGVYENPSVEDAGAETGEGAEEGGVGVEGIEGAAEESRDGD